MADLKVPIPLQKEPVDPGKEQGRAEQNAPTPHFEKPEPGQHYGDRAGDDHERPGQAKEPLKLALNHSRYRSPAGQYDGRSDIDQDVRAQDLPESGGDPSHQPLVDPKQQIESGPAQVGIGGVMFYLDAGDYLGGEGHNFKLLFIA